MRRAALLCTVLGFVAAGVGCKAVTGQHDCTYDPSHTQLPSTTSQPQFPTVGSPYTGGVVTDLPTPEKGK
jgi:hypothetical protein